jgi:hypothetical protein
VSQNNSIKLGHIAIQAKKPQRSRGSTDLILQVRPGLPGQHHTHRTFSRANSPGPFDHLSHRCLIDKRPFSSNLAHHLGTFPDRPSLCCGCRAAMGLQLVHLHYALRLGRRGGIADSTLNRKRSRCGSDGTKNCSQETERAVNTVWAG